MVETPWSTGVVTSLFGKKFKLDKLAVDDYTGEPFFLVTRMFAQQCSFVILFASEKSNKLPILL